MKTILETIKNAYAIEQGYEDWNEIRKDFRDKFIGFSTLTKHENEICIRAQKAALEKATLCHENGRKKKLIPFRKFQNS